MTTHEYAARIGASYRRGWNDAATTEYRPDLADDPAAYIAGYKAARHQVPPDTGEAA